MSRSLPRHSSFIRRFWHPDSLTPPRFARWRSLSVKRRDDNPMPPEAADYWKPILDDVGSPTAQILRDQLDMNDVTGLPKDMSKQPANLDYHTEIKKQFPEKLVVVQNGKFYETLGHDAVLFVNACGLMPMGLYAGTPSAGFPVDGLEKIRHIMVEQLQYSMVVCDQFSLPEDAHQFSRRIVAIYNPGEITGEEPKPIPTSTLVSLNWTRDGFQLLAFRRDRLIVELTTGMTEDAMWGWMFSTAICAPVCIHEDFMRRVPNWKRKMRSVAPHIANRTHRLQGDAMTGFLDFIRRHYGYEDEHDIVVVEVEKEGGRRRCPSFYTASQLGMTGANGIPNLLDFVVPSTSLKPVKAWLKDLLLVPRPMEATVAVRAALESIAELTESVPSLRTYLSPGAVTKVCLVSLGLAMRWLGI